MFFFWETFRWIIFPHTPVAAGVRAVSKYSPKIQTVYWLFLWNFTAFRNTSANVFSRAVTRLVKSQRGARPPASFWIHRTKCMNHFIFLVKFPIMSSIYFLEGTKSNSTLFDLCKFVSWDIDWFYSKIHCSRKLRTQQIYKYGVKLCSKNCPNKGYG